MSTGGEGGMVTTNSRDLWSKIWSYKDHGKSREAGFERVHPPGFQWVHESFGTNGRMTEIQAAIGRIQLTRMQDWHNVRCENANAILDLCEQFPTLFRVAYRICLDQGLAEDLCQEAFMRYLQRPTPLPNLLVLGGRFKTQMEAGASSRALGVVS